VQLYLDLFNYQYSYYGSVFSMEFQSCIPSVVHSIYNMDIQQNCLVVYTFKCKFVLISLELSQCIFASNIIYH